MIVQPVVFKPRWFAYFTGKFSEDINYGFIGLT